MPKITAGSILLDADLVVFDKDGTLIDFQGVWGVRAVAAIEALCRGFPEIEDLNARLRSALGVSPESDALRSDGPYAAAPFSDIYALAAGVLFQAGLRWEEAVVSVRSIFLPPASAPLQPFEMVPIGDPAKLFDALKAAGFTVVVATTDNRHDTLDTLTHLACAQTVHRVFCGDDPPPRKPEPALLRDVSREFGVSPDRILVVSDTRTDLTMAREVGAGFVGVLSGAGVHADFDGADAIIESIQELVVSP